MSILTILNNLEWRQPLWLLLMLQPLILWLIIYWKDNRASNQFADKHLLPWVQITDQKTLIQRIFSRDTSYFLSMVFLAIAMAGPRTPLESADTKQASALDIMLVVDVSASMKAVDIKPSRLKRGVQELHELLSLVKRDDVRFGSVVYAARPHVFVPITNDVEALEFYLKDLDQLVLPTQGSDASAALLLASKELQAIQASSENEKKQSKAILWLTDGDFANTQDKAQIKSTLKSLKKMHIPTFILGLGTPEGSAVPLRKGGWLEHNGQGVISKMDVELLENFAKLGGGKFSKTFDDERDWQALYKQGLLNIVARDIKIPLKNEDQQWVVYYQWFLFIGMILLLISLAPIKLASARRGKNQTSVAANFLLGSLFISLLISPVSEIRADESTLSPILQESIKNYNNQEYELATSGFVAMVLQAQNANERGIAMHNLGNNYFQQGDYENAEKLFEDALRYAPNQTQTKNNLILTNELNALLQRRNKRRNTARLPNQGTGRGLLGDQKQTSSMMTSRMLVPKNIKLPEIPKENLNILLSKGLTHLQMLESAEATKQRQKQRNIEHARISLLRDQDSSLAMWKRLFEIEEGFPAKLKKPKTVPGQVPW